MAFGTGGSSTSRTTFLGILALAGVLLAGCGPGEPGTEARASAGEAGEARPSAGTSENADPRADSLVGAWIRALGGMENYHRLRSARFTLTTEMWDSVSGRLRRTRPRYVVIDRWPGVEAARIERWEGDDFIAHGTDGDTVWATLNGEPLGPGDQDYDQVPYVAGDVNYWISLPYKLRDPGVILTYMGRDDQDRHDVRVTFGEGVGDHQDTWHYYFADGQTWPVEVTYQEAGSETVHRTRWEDVQQVDGYYYVGRRVHFQGDRDRVWKVIRTSDVELNPELDPAVFSDPERSPWSGGAGEG